MLLRVAAIAALVAGAGAGCSDDAPASCPIGDRTQPIEILVEHWPQFPAPGNIEGLANDEVVDLVRPIQGGKVLYVGVRARNVDGCNVQLTAALRDPTTQQVIALEQRPVRLVVGADGWGHAASPADDLANVPACPNAAARTDIDVTSWTIEVRLDEVGGRTASTSIIARPRCRLEDQIDECECECDSDYVLGQPCPMDPVFADAGVD